MRVTIIGAGRVGLTTALALDYLGHEVTCVDSSPQVLETLRQKRAPFPDPDLDILLPSSGLRVGGGISPETVSTDIVMIAVPTPPLPDGHADLSAVLAVAARLAEVAPDGAFSVVAIKSTVPPGTADAVQRLIDQALRSRGSSSRISVASNPEFLRQGSALADTFYPDRIVIGTNDSESERRLQELYGAAVRQDFLSPAALPRPSACTKVPLISTRPVNAELIKYAANTFLATKISFINEIARLAEKLGADIADVSLGVGLDHRIGSAYFRPGPGWGGPCLGKDARALLALGQELDQDMPLLSAAVKTNADQREHIVERLEDAMGSLQGATIGLLGLSFKAGTDDTADSPAMDVAELLLERGAAVRSYDPLAEPRAMRERPELAIQYHDSPRDMIDGCDAILLMTEWEEFRSIPWTELAERVHRRLLLDARNFLDAGEIESAGFAYIGIGR